MSPAQKAWATRRAKLAAATALTAVMAATPVPSVTVNVSTSETIAAQQKPVGTFQAREAVESLQLVELYVNESNIGCGRYLFVVLEMGEDTVRLFQPAQLETVLVNRKFFDKQHVVPKRGQVSRTRVAQIIKRNRALADRVNDRDMRTGSNALADGGADAVRALQLLGA